MSFTRVLILSFLLTLSTSTNAYAPSPEYLAYLNLYMHGCYAQWWGDSVTYREIREAIKDMGPEYTLHCPDYWSA